MKPTIISLMQSVLVFIGATVSSLLYVTLRINGVTEIDNIDKFWCSLPLFASLTTTNRCIVGRVIRFIIRSKR